MALVMVARIKLYGALRALAQDGLVELPVTGQTETTVMALKQQLIADLQLKYPNQPVDELIKRSALSSGARVFQQHETIDLLQPLHLLPPVCGG